MGPQVGDLPSMDLTTLLSTGDMLGTNLGTCIRSFPHLTTENFLSPQEDPGEEIPRNKQASKGANSRLVAGGLVEATGEDEAAQGFFL